MKRALLGTLIATQSLSAQRAAGTLDVISAGRFASLALACVHREYPNKISHVLNGPEDVKSPSQLTPAYGCYDWHSAVHGHWLLARLVGAFPNAPFAGPAIAALQKNLTPANIAAEVKYMSAPGRETFERPYGLAWLLQFAAELRESPHRDVAALGAVLRPLESATVVQLKKWLPRLAYAIREGEHPQTAFAFGLILDYARVVRDEELANLIAGKVIEFHLEDKDCPIHYEPSGQDFVSPCLAEADVVRRVLAPREFAIWLTGFLPRIPTDGSADWLAIGVVTDKTDGKLAHLDGLNLSRAWMLEGIASGLASDDPRRRALLAAAATHATSGLASVTGETYEGGQWLGSFATYLTTRRGTSR